MSSWRSTPAKLGTAALQPGGSSAYVDGDSLMGFVAEQPGVGSVAHLHRQLVVLDELMKGNLHQSMHKRPLTVYRFLDVIASNLAVEEGWSRFAMARLVASLWSLRSANIRYATAPLTCPASPSGRCRVTLDPAAGPGFWAAVREDHLDGWLVEHRLRSLANRLRADPS